MSTDPSLESWSDVELTTFDALSSGVSFGTAWLVQGVIDKLLLETAVSRVVDKWRLLAGRIRREGQNWLVRVPLGVVPPSYATYSFTSSTDNMPLSLYVSLPLSTSSTALPEKFFMPEFLPTSNEQYRFRSHPLVSFHITEFLPETETSPTFSCIGLTLPHGVFDGVGAAFICRAVSAELNGLPWKIPPLPTEPFHYSKIQDLLLSEDFPRRGPFPPLLHEDLLPAHKSEVNGLTRGYDENRASRIILIPPSAHSHLVDSVRLLLSAQGVGRVSSGDVLVAWILKTMYSRSSSPETLVNIQTLASFRHLFPSVEDISTSPHSCLSLLPTPLISIYRIQTLPLHELAKLHSQARHAFSEHDVSSLFKQLTTTGQPSTQTAAPVVPLVISNASCWRLIEIDWSKAGVEKTICGYRKLHNYEKTGIDAIQMIGRLADGSIVLDTVLSERHARLLAEGAEGLVVHCTSNPSHEQLVLG